MKATWILALAACGGAASPEPDSGIHAMPDGKSSTSAALYPLGAGDRWTYAVAAVGAGSVCAAGTYMQEVVSTDAVGGRAAVQMTSFCTGVAGTNSYAAGSGDEVDFYYNGGWLVLVDPMLVDGHTWSYFNTSYRWKRETTVVVPAGTYSDCWTAVQNVSYTAYLTYCRGVGLVRSYSSDLNGAGWDAQLSAANIK
jgi:hypothetical protein